MEGDQTDQSDDDSNPWRTVAVLLISTAVIFVVVTSQLMY
jgi:hypothetical protein